MTYIGYTLFRPTQYESLVCKGRLFCIALASYFNRFIITPNVVHSIKESILLGVDSGTARSFKERIFQRTSQTRIIEFGQRLVLVVHPSIFCGLFPNVESMEHTDYQRYCGPVSYLTSSQNGRGQYLTRIHFISPQRSFGNILHDRQKEAP